jgi:hypothetical protein
MIPGGEAPSEPDCATARREARAPRILQGHLAAASSRGRESGGKPPHSKVSWRLRVGTAVECGRLLPL